MRQVTYSYDRGERTLTAQNMPHHVINNVMRHGMIDIDSEFIFVVIIHVSRSIQRLLFQVYIEFSEKSSNFCRISPPPPPCISMKVNLPAGQGRGVAVPAVQ